MQKTWQKLRNNPKLWQQYFVRGQVERAIRDFYLKHKYHEVEVPILTPTLIPESYLEVFASTLLNRNRQEKRVYLTPSPEVFLKKLLVAGIGNCFTITKSFRNTEMGSNRHNPEFTMLEWYHVDTTHTYLMQQMEALFVYLMKTMYPHQKLQLTYQGTSIDLTPPWKRMTMTEAFAKFAGIKLEQNLTLDRLSKTAQNKDYQVNSTTTWEELFNQIYLNEIEPKFPKNHPFILCDYPSQVAALARKKPTDPRFCERFEVYIAGYEILDCCTELTDVKEQEKRFAHEQEERERASKTPYPADTEFLDALRLGLPPCAGGALGIDRLTMVLADVKTIQDTLFFPMEEMI